jgi:hypothetical protein
MKKAGRRWVARADGSVDVSGDETRVMKRALDAHVIAAHTRAFRDKLSPMEGSPYDARFYEELD